jgi:hypothetical protein
VKEVVGRHGEFQLYFSPAGALGLHQLVPILGTSCSVAKQKREPGSNSLAGKIQQFFHVFP